jgi:hypothetical protein
VRCFGKAKQWGKGCQIVKVTCCHIQVRIWKFEQDRYFNVPSRNDRGQRNGRENAATSYRDRTAARPPCVSGRGCARRCWARPPGHRETSSLGRRRYRERRAGDGFACRPSDIGRHGRRSSVARCRAEGALRQPVRHGVAQGRRWVEAAASPVDRPTPRRQHRAAGGLGSRGPGRDRGRRRTLLSFAAGSAVRFWSKRRGWLTLA